MKNSSDTFRDRTCDVPACSALSQPTMPPRMSDILPPSQPICPIENFHQPGHAVAAAMLRTAIKDTRYMASHTTSVLCIDGQIGWR
jgi:hypothetical protein